MQRKNNNKIEIKEKKINIIKKFKVHEPIALLDFLFLKITNDSKNNIKHLLSNKQVMVDGVVVSQFNFMLAKDDMVEIAKDRVNQDSKVKIKIDKIYEDNELIAINKPAGLLSIESDNETINTAYNLVMDYVRITSKQNRVYIVHRIDKETSGVLLFAKNEKIRDILQKKWQDIVKTREYIAIVEGKLDNKQGQIKSYLMINEITNLMYSTNNKNGKLAITNYKVIKENNKYSMLQVKIDSGRKNQIRVHMHDLNHPIIGDDKYMSKINPIKRLGLHASLLEFTHPITNKVISIKAKYPTIFNTLF